MSKNGSNPEEGSQEPLSTEAQEAMDAFSALEAAGSVDNSANFSTEFVAEVNQAVTNDVISKQIAQSVFACDDEKGAKLWFKATLAGMEVADEAEAVMQVYGGEVKKLMASFQGDLTSEQKEEFDTRFAQLGEEYIAKLKALSVSDETLVECGLMKATSEEEQAPDQYEAAVDAFLGGPDEDLSAGFDPYVLEQIQELEKKGLLPPELARKIKTIEPADALRILTKVMVGLLAGEEFELEEQLKALRQDPDEEGDIESGLHAELKD